MKRSEAIAKLTADLESLRAEVAELTRINQALRVKVNLDAIAGFPHGDRMKQYDLDKPARMSRPGKEKRTLQENDDGDE